MNIKKLHKKLIKKNITLSLAESCTGGLLSSKFTRLSGSSKYFQMGLVTYSNDAKIKILKVKTKGDILENHPIDSFIGKGFFVKEIQEMLLAKKT